MAGLEGTINTPVGTVSKKTALMLGAATIGVAGIIWYRQKKMASNAAASTPTDGEIDPATGYPYGSPEDAAALASQNSYVSPPSSSGGGGSSVPSSNVGYTSNGQWEQAVIQTMTNNGTLSDPSLMSAALGKYITGAYVDPNDTNTNSLIQQAIAAEGFPPISGANGYPPSINRNAPSGSGPTASGVVHVNGLHATHATANTLQFDWTWDQAPDYSLYYKDNVPIANAGPITQFVLRGLKPNTTYRFTVRGVKGTNIGPSAAVSATTTK